VPAPAAPWDGTGSSKLKIKQPLKTGLGTHETVRQENLGAPAGVYSPYCIYSYVVLLGVDLLLQCMSLSPAAERESR
jgi:hypothetical protein